MTPTPTKYHLLPLPENINEIHRELASIKSCINSSEEIATISAAGTAAAHSLKEKTEESKEDKKEFNEHK